MSVFYHFPSFDGVNTDIDESFPGISKAGVQCPVIQGSVACNGLKLVICKIVHVFNISRSPVDSHF